MNFFCNPKKQIWLALCLPNIIYAQNLFTNGSFETGTFLGNATIGTPANNVDNSGQGDISGWWRDNGVYWIQDATQAPHGNRFLYIPIRGECIAQTNNLGTGVLSACKRYKITFDGAGFDHLNLGGGVGLSAFTVEVKYADNSNNEVLKVLDRRGFTDVNTGQVAQNPVVPSAWNNLVWKRMTTYFTIPNAPAGATKLQVFISNSMEVGGATKGVLLDNLVLEEVPAPVAQAGGTCITDFFCTQAYNNNAANWAGDWTEQGDNNNPTTGQININFGSLAITNANSGTPKVYRAVNLAGAVTANLAFDYATSAELSATDDFIVEISNNGGVSYTRLATFSGDGGGTVDYDITPYIAANTQIRFGVLSTTDYANIEKVMYISNVRICTTLCAVTDAGLNDIACYPNGTPTNGADDFIFFTLNPTGTNMGGTYNVAVSSGTITPTTGTYGSKKYFTLQNGSAAAGNIVVTITDATTSGCSKSVTLTNPGICVTTACSNNLLINPSFEVDALNTTPPTGWSGSGVVAGNNMAEPDGTKYMYHSSGAAPYQDVAALHGQSFQLSFYSGTHSPAGQTIRLMYLDATKTLLGTPAVHTITYDTDGTTPQMLAGPYTLSLGMAPVGTAFVRVEINRNGTDYAKIDAFCLTRSTICPPQICLPAQVQRN